MRIDERKFVTCVSRSLHATELRLERQTNVLCSISFKCLHREFVFYSGMNVLNPGLPICAEFSKLRGLSGDWRYVGKNAAIL